jgi:hypothetical protein
MWFLTSTNELNLIRGSSKNGDYARFSLNDS